MQAYRRAYRMAQVRLYSQQQQPLDAASRLTAAIIELDAASPCFAYGDGDGGGGGGDDGPPGGALFAGVGVQMKQHQLALLRRCLELENGPLTLSALASLSHRGMPDHMVEAHDHNYLRTRIGVLGDKVGSGKSYVILALVLAGPSAWAITTTWNGTGNWTNTSCWSAAWNCSISLPSGSDSTDCRRSSITTSRSV